MYPTGPSLLPRERHSTYLARWAQSPAIPGHLDHFSSIVMNS
jgi:hypothetical protein